MQTRIFEVSTPLGLCTVLAVRKRLGTEDTRDILLVTSNGLHPEVEAAFRFDPKVLALARREFAEVVDLNDLIAPYHPSGWVFHGSASVYRQVWLRALGLDHVDTLVLESLQVPPSLSLAQIFGPTQLIVYSDGLMVYSPTRFTLPESVLRRVTDVFYLDYLPSVKPLLLRETDTQYTALPLSSVAEWLAPKSVTSRSTGPGDLLMLGQSLATSGIMSERAEVALYLEPLVALTNLGGFNRVVFKTHPGASSTLHRALARAYQSRTGQPLVLIESTEPVEWTVASGNFSAVVGVFSTALITLTSLFHLPAFAFGTRELLLALSPYENSNRIPLLAADYYLPKLERLTNRPSGDAEGLAEFLRATLAERPPSAENFTNLQLAVGYLMQPVLLEAERASAHRAIASVREMPEWRDVIRMAPSARMARSKYQLRRALKKATGRLTSRLKRYLK